MGRVPSPGPNTLITFFISEAAAEEETLLVKELKELGAAICVIVNRATPELKKHSDLLIELALDGPEFARYAVTAIPAHLMGTAIGLRKGLNPDAPEKSHPRRGPGRKRQRPAEKERCLSEQTGTTNPGPRLRRTLTLWNLIVIGIVIISPSRRWESTASSTMPPVGTSSPLS